MMEALLIQLTQRAQVVAKTRLVERVLAQMAVAHLVRAIPRMILCPD
jgi:hypothetical protein